MLDKVQIENTIKHVHENRLRGHTARRYPEPVDGAIRFLYHYTTAILFISRENLDIAKQTFDNFVESQYANIFIEVPRVKPMPCYTA